MKKSQLVLVPACLAIWLGACFSAPVLAAARSGQSQEESNVLFFDVPELPARIDEPKLHKSAKGLVLECAIANRSSEELLGLRLILLVIDVSGKLRSRVTWTEGSDIASYSIKNFTFHPGTAGTFRSNDQLVLGIDEVIGRETIWRAAGAEKALRAYSRGQHDVLPKVRTFANKFDSPERFGALPRIP